MEFNFKQYVKPAMKFMRQNAPLILSGVSNVTSGAAVVLAAVQRDEHVRLRNEKLTEDHDHLTFMEELECGAKAYWKPALLYSVSVLTSVKSNQTYLERLAFMATAYRISEKDKVSTEEAVLKTFGPSGVEKVESAAAGDAAMAAKRYYDEGKIIKTGLGDQLFLDTKSGRFFESDYDWVKGTFLELNAELARDERALNELYLKNRLDPMDFGEYGAFGWHEGTKIDWKIRPQRFEDQFDNRVINVIDYPIQDLMDNNYEKFADY